MVLPLWRASAPPLAPLQTSETALRGRYSSVLSKGFACSTELHRRAAGRQSGSEWPQSWFGKKSPVPVRPYFPVLFQNPALEPCQNPDARSERHRWQHGQGTQWARCPGCARERADLWCWFATCRATQGSHGLKWGRGLAYWTKRTLVKTPVCRKLMRTGADRTGANR